MASAKRFRMSVDKVWIGTGEVLEVAPDGVSLGGS